MQPEIQQTIQFHTVGQTVRKNVLIHNLSAKSCDCLIKTISPLCGAVSRTASLNSRYRGRSQAGADPLWGPGRIGAPYPLGRCVDRLLFDGHFHHRGLCRRQQVGQADPTAVSAARLIGRGPVQSDAVMLCTTKKSRLKQYGLAHLLLSILATHPILEQMPPLPTAHMRLSPLAQLLDAQPLA